MRALTILSAVIILADKFRPAVVDHQATDSERTLRDKSIAVYLCVSL